MDGMGVPRILGRHPIKHCRLADRQLIDLTRPQCLGGDDCNNHRKGEQNALNT